MAGKHRRQARFSCTQISSTPPSSQCASFACVLQGLRVRARRASPRATRGHAVQRRHSQGEIRMAGAHYQSE
eukprot:scaffold133085_cov29-Tisochrysis_lutea.AAC.4